MKTFLFLSAIYSIAFSFQIAETDAKKIDSLFRNCPNSKYNRVCCSSPRTYISFSSLDIGYNLDTIVNFLEDSRNYAKSFRWFDIFERINPVDSIWYYKISYGPFGYWSLINSEKITVNDTCAEFIYFQNRDTSLNAIHRKRCKRLIVIENRDQILEWKLLKLSEKRTCVGFVVQSVPSLYVPNWLYKMTINMVIPETLKDIERNLRERESAK